MNADISKLFNSTIVNSRFDKCLEVNFTFSDDRENEIRSLISQYADNDDQIINAAAVELAERLAFSMDRRSSPCLFVITGFIKGEMNQIILWAFPKDEALRLNVSTKGSTIELLNDIFSQTSRLRKAASFEGGRHANSYLSGKIVDYQANQSERQIARFWIEEFLQCCLALSPAAGTKILADSLKVMSQKTKNFDEQQKITAAVMSVRNSPKKSWTPTSFADAYFDNVLKKRFLKCLPNTVSEHLLFDFDKETFDLKVGYSSYELDTGAVVTTPLNQVGVSVQVSEGENPTLTCEGRVMSERLRTRRNVA